MKRRPAKRDDRHWQNPTRLPCRMKRSVYGITHSLVSKRPRAHDFCGFYVLLPAGDVLAVTACTH